jgi:single-strand DNA-binding protein
MKMIGLVRLGRDAEVRYSPDGTPVAAFYAAYNHGRKVDGEQPTQWIDCTLWGTRAEKLADYLKKGTLIEIIGEPHVETFEKRDGSPGWKLAVRLDDLQFAGGRSDGEQRQAAPAAAPAPRAAAPAPRAASKPSTGTGFDSMDDDIPF